MALDFVKIQQQIYKYLVDQKKITPKEGEDADFAALYALLNIGAPPSDLDSPEGMEYLKDLVEEFMELDYIITAADDDKNKELSVTEKGDFMTEELDLDLTAEDLEELFGPEEVETPTEPSGSSGPGGGTPSTPSTPSTPPTTGGDEEIPQDQKVKQAKDDMDAAELTYQEAIAELMENDPVFAALEQDRIATNEQIVAQEEENTALETESQELDVEIARLDSEISACDAEIKTLNDQLASISDEDPDAASKRSAINAQIAEQEQKKADLEADKKAAQDRKEEIDGTLLPAGITALEELNTHLNEVETEISTTLKEKDEKASTAFKDYTDKRNTYETVKAEYDAEQEKIREQELNEQKAQYLKKDEQYGALSDILLDGSATSDAIKESVEEAKFDEGEDTSYSIGTNGNYSVTGIKDGKEVTIYYDSEGKEVSRKSTDADVILAERASGINSSIREELGLAEDADMPEIEYELDSDGKVVATIDGQGSFVINKDGDVVGRPLGLVSEETAETDTEKEEAQALKTIETELGEAIADASSVSYEKTENGYIITAVGADGKETTYTYGMKENEDKTKTPVLESSSDVSAIVKSSENPELAEQVVGDVETMLSNKGQEGTDVEYTIVDGQIVVTSTFGGKDTTYKFDEEGKFIGSSDARDVVEDKDLARYLNSTFADEEGDYVFNSNEDGTISASTNGEAIILDVNGEIVNFEFDSLDKTIEAFKEMAATIEGIDAEALSKALKDSVNEKITSSGLKVDGDLAYSLSSDGNLYVTGTVDGKEVKYGFDPAGTLVSSPDLSEIMPEDSTEESKAKIDEALSGLNIDSESIQYTSTGAGIEAVITDKNGNETKVVLDMDGKILESSDISNVGIETEEDKVVQGKVTDGVEALNLPQGSEVKYFRNQDGTYTVTSVYGGVENKYTFNTEGKLTASTDIDALAENDEDVIRNLASSMANIGSPIIEKTDDGYVITKVIGEGDSAKEVTFELDKEGNIKDFTNIEDVLGSDFKNSALDKLSTAGFETEGAKFNFDEEGNLIVKCKDKETGKDVEITLNSKQDIVSSSTSKGTGLSAEKEKNINDGLSSAGVTDTSNCTYEFSESGAVTVTNIQDGVETTYIFDKEGNMTGYKNAVGSFELQTDGENKTVVFEPAGGGKAVTLNVENLSEAANLFTPEQLKEIQAQAEALNNAEGTTNASRIANSMGINPSGDDTYISSSDLYNEMIDVEEVQAGDVMFISCESGDSYSVSVVAKVIETPEGGTAYVTIETDRNGNTKVVVRTPDEETDYCFKRQGNA